MRLGVMFVMLAARGAALAGMLSGAGWGPVWGASARGVSPARVALVPNAVAFRDPRHGLLGTGWLGCDHSGFGCRPQGTISLTSDGGRSWTVALRTPRPVVSVSISGRVWWARFDDGENLASNDQGRTWRPAVFPNQVASPCPPALAISVSQVVTTPGGREWALCAGQGGAGSMGKAVYRLTTNGWKRVAYTPFDGLTGHGYGGIGLYGYPLGITMADDGFGLIWESRGTLYVTRDGGSHWLGLPKVARPEIDFGQSGCALPHGVGYILLSLGGSQHRRLLVSLDRGRTWRVAHRWP